MDEPRDTCAKIEWWQAQIILCMALAGWAILASPDGRWIPVSLLILVCIAIAVYSFVRSAAKRHAQDSEREPSLLKAATFAQTDRGSFEWNSSHNADLLTVSNNGQTIEWGPRKPEYTGKQYPPAWIPASTRSRLHSGHFEWDFVIDEMAGGQIGIGFMLLWEIGPDWGFFGYLGSSSSAWAYDPSTGDVVNGTKSIQGGLPKIAGGRAGVVTVRLDLPRYAAGMGRFSVNGTESMPIELPEGSVVLPAACFLKERQKVTLANFRVE
jgi:hypothetical protein